MSKKLIYGKEAREIVRRGMNIVADAVAPTLGAQGKSVLIDCDGLSPILADDGGTILKHLAFSNREVELVNKYIQKLGLKMHNKSGDGRSTAVTLMRALTNAALDEIGDDSHRIPEVHERLWNGLNQTLALLSEFKSEIKDEDLASVATIASLDPEAGKVIADTFLQVGRDGIVTVEESPIVGISSEVVKGMRFQKGLTTPYFINEPEKERCVLETPHVFITDRRISINPQIVSWLNAVVASGNTSILVVALDVEGEALASLVMNNQRKAIRVACVQAPYSGQRQRDFLKDLAILTGATVVSEEAGMKLDTATAAVLGKAEKVMVDMNETTIVNGAGDRKLIDERLASLRELLAMKETDHDRKIVQARIASLSGGIGVIRIGALSDVELKKRRDKIEDAIHSVKLALEEGIVPGGGAPFTKIATQIEDPIFRKVLTAPFERMARNAGMFDHRGWIARLFKTEPTVYDAIFDVWDGEKNEGYNFKTRIYCDLVESKIIDPFKVERIALESAVSFVAQVITTDEVMLEEDAPKKNE